ncbi:MAG: anti-sigma factor family protein [Chroococcales cyanobacterium]
MNPNYESHHTRQKPALGGSRSFNLTDDRNQPMALWNSVTPDSAQLDDRCTDQFELLSAYLDGEVTDTERQQVEGWLSSDASLRDLHSRLLTLHQGLTSLPAPPKTQPVEALLNGVFSRIDEIEQPEAVTPLVGDRPIAAISADRFELLSAYLDGEVTETERQQVESWLSSDASLRDLHSKLLTLHQELVSLPAPSAAQPVDALLNAVFSRIDAIEQPEAVTPLVGDRPIAAIPAEQFELLSAYLDGEVTETERQQVESWLSNDATFRQVQAGLLTLRQELVSLPAPSAAQPFDALLNAVFSRIDAIEQPEAVTPLVGDRPIAAIPAEQFELLSAYLDGEATHSESEQVESWLSNDATFRQVHSRLLTLRQELVSLPAPLETQPVDALLTGVFSRIDHLEQLEAKIPMVSKGENVAIAAERFELVSAYIDGEATQSERRQVQEWLDRDPEVKRLYLNLIKLRETVQVLPVPAPVQPVQETVHNLFRRLDRQRQRRVLWGGVAIAALVLAGLSSLIFRDRTYSPQMATVPAETQTPSERLMIALNGSVVEIPEAPEATAPKPIESRALFVE